MRVQDVMTTGVKTIAPTASGDDAWSAMQVHGVHHLVVTDRSRVVGVVSARDIGGRRGATTRMNQTIGELMTAPAVTAEPATTVRKAANMMRGRSIGALVVVKADRAVGIVTVSDLLDLLGRGVDRGTATTHRRTLSHRVPHRKTRPPSRAW